MSDKDHVSDRRNGEAGRRKTDSIVERLDTMELAVGSMGQAVRKLTDDFREIHKETVGIRRAERITAVANIFMRKFGRCIRHKIDNFYLGMRWFLPRIGLLALILLAIKAAKQEQLIEWLAKLWVP